MGSYRQRFLRSAKAASVGRGPRTPAQKAEAARKYDIANANINLNAGGTKHPTRPTEK